MRLSQHGTMGAQDERHIDTKCGEDEVTYAIGATGVLKAESMYNRYTEQQFWYNRCMKVPAVKSAR